MEAKHDILGPSRPSKQRTEHGEQQELPGEGMSRTRVLLVFALIIGCFALIAPRFIFPMFKAFSTGGEKVAKDPFERAYLPPRMQGRPGPPETRPSGVRDRPAHHPSARFTTEQTAVPDSKGSLYFMLPMYTIGIICFLLYTFWKVISKSSQPPTVPRAERIRYDADRQIFTDQRARNTKPTPIPNPVRKEDKQSQPEERKVSDYEIKQLEEKLAQTEAQMNALILKMATMQALTNQAVAGENEVHVGESPQIQGHHYGEEEQSDQDGGSDRNDQSEVEDHEEPHSQVEDDNQEEGARGNEENEEPKQMPDLRHRKGHILRQTDEEGDMEKQRNED